MIIPNKTITLTINTDGVQSAKSKATSFWPVHAIINELRPTVRLTKRNKILAGLWYDTEAPDMSLYLFPIIEELKQLSSTGIAVQLNGATEQIKVHVIICVCDCPAKSKVLYQNQHNGYYSCPYCLKKGENVSGNIRFLYQETMPPLRTDSFIRQSMMKAYNSIKANKTIDIKETHGYRGVSPLCLLPHFDLSHGPVIDYMHHISGTMKNLIPFLLNEYKDEFTNFNAKLLNIKGISEMNRHTRSLLELSQYKSLELIHFLIFYGPLVFNGIISNKHYQLFCTLSVCVYIMLKSIITPSEIDLVEGLLNQFVKQYQEIFGDNNMTAIVHQLLHLPDSIRHYGPLWCYSGFSFEDENGNLLKFIRGPKNILHQISERLTFKRNFYDINFLNSSTVKPEVKEFILDSKKKTYANRIQVESTLMNNEKKVYNLIDPVQTIDEERKKLSSIFGISYHEFNCQEYQQLEISNVIYKSDRCRKLKSTDDTFIKLNDNTYAKIMRIFLIRNNSSNYVYIEVAKYKDVTHEKKFPLHFTVYEYEKQESIEFYLAEQISEKAISIYYNDKYIHLTTMPNTFESD